MTDEEEISCLQEFEDGHTPAMKEEHTYNSRMGDKGATTMRVVGEVDGHKLHILIVSGSTLSFLREDTAKRLGCKVIHDKPLLVRVARGKKLASIEKAADFKWVIQGNEFTFSPRLLGIEGCDLILGGDCLKFCTPIDLDYKQMTFTITLKEKRVKLQAITTNSDCKMIAGPTLFTMLHSELSQIEENFVNQSSGYSTQRNSDIEQLLEEFEEIFEEPTGLLNLEV